MTTSVQQTVTRGETVKYGESAGYKEYGSSGGYTSTGVLQAINGGLGERIGNGYGQQGVSTGQNVQNGQSTLIRQDGSKSTSRIIVTSNDHQNIDISTLGYGNSLPPSSQPPKPTTPIYTTYSPSPSPYPSNPYPSSYVATSNIPSSLPVSHISTETVPRINYERCVTECKNW